MRDLYVVTHSESIHHVERRVGGSSVGGGYDPGLTRRGERQAEAIAARLGDLIKGSAPRLIASDLARARGTAERIATRFGVEIEESADLREMSYGIAEGKPQSWLDARFQPAPEYDRLDFRSIEGGETRREFATRVYRAMEEVLQASAETQVIVTHGFAMTFVIAAWIRMPLDAVGHLTLKATSGGITHLRVDDYFRNRQVVFLNATDHLDGI